MPHIAHYRIHRPRMDGWMDGWMDGGGRGARGVYAGSRQTEGVDSEFRLVSFSDCRASNEKVRAYKSLFLRRTLEIDVTWSKKHEMKMKAVVFYVFARDVALFFFSDLKISSIDYEICAESKVYHRDFVRGLRVDCKNLWLLLFLSHPKSWPLVRRVDQQKHITKQQQQK
jgi:hypothetical protein